MWLNCISVVDFEEKTWLQATNTQSYTSRSTV